MRGLKISIDDLEPEDVTSVEERVCDDGVRLGGLLVSSHGVSSSSGASYVLSPDDLIILPAAEGGFLGKGSSGAVRKATNKRNGAVVAVKEIKVTSQAHLTEIRRELETLYESAEYSSSRFLVDFYGAFSHEGSVFIAMECLDGSLDEVPRPVTLPVLAHVLRSVLQGLVYLHRTRHLIHRDLKPSNVLFNRQTGEIKISDFGVSSVLEGTKGDAHSFVGTVTYMSPERLKGEVYSYAADIWSLGLLVAELALGKCPFAGLRGDSTEARFWSLLQHLSRDGPVLELPGDLDPDLADFITKCVAKNPEQRPSVTALLQHRLMTTHINLDVSPLVRDQADREAVRVWLAQTATTSAVRRRKRLVHSPLRNNNNNNNTNVANGEAAAGGSGCPAWPALALETESASTSSPDDTAVIELAGTRGVNLDEELDKLLQ